jgi:hypothetical protein
LRKPFVIKNIGAEKKHKHDEHKAISLGVLVCSVK